MVVSNVLLMVSNNVVASYDSLLSLSPVSFCKDNSC